MPRPDDYGDAGTILLLVAVLPLVLVIGATFGAMFVLGGWGRIFADVWCGP